MTRCDRRISVAPVADGEALARLHAGCFEQPWSAESFENLLSHPGVSALGALADEAPAGFVLLRQVADEAEILTICVLNEARRQGVGQALFQATLSRLPGISTLFIEVDVINAGAVRFYEHLGFQVTGRRKDYYQHSDGTKTDALTMSYAMNSSTPR